MILLVFILLAIVLYKEFVQFRLRNLVFTSLGHFVNDGAVFFMPLIADILANQKSLSPLDVTLLFVAFYSSSSILSVYIGNLADRTGKAGPMIGLGLGLLSFGLLGFSIAATYTTGIVLSIATIVSAFFTGFGSAFYHPLGAAVLQSTFNDKSRGKALGANGAAGSFGRALYPSLFFLAAVLFTTYGSIAFFALIGFIAAAFIWIGLKAVSLSHVRQESVQNLPVAKAKNAVTRGIVILTLVASVRSLATAGVNAWIPIFISTQKGLGLTHELGLMLTTMYALAIIGQPLFGLLVDRFDKRLVLVLSSVGSGLSVIGYIYTTGAIEIALLSLFGFFTFSAFPLVLSLASDYTLPGSSSLANALVWGIGVTGGGAIGPAIIGFIILNDYANLGFAFEVMSIITLISAVGTIFIPKSEKAGKMPLFG